MSLLDDARQMIECQPLGELDGRVGCVFCNVDAGWPHGGVYRFDHKPDCPWLSMSKLVAVLEAAESLVGLEYQISGNPVPPRFLDARNVNRLITALRGER